LRCVLPGALALLLFPASLLPTSTWAQANDAAYCVELGELAVRYAGSPGAGGETRPNFAVLEAIENCSKGNTASGIKVLEQILRSNGLTLPKRMAPA
jgi:hypothetical protein